MKVYMAGTDCEETYLLNPLVCDITDNVVFTEKFDETTVSLCKKLCSNLPEAEKCSGFLYDGITRSCVITSFTGENTVWFNESEAQKAKNRCLDRQRYYYRKQRCLGNILLLSSHKKDKNAK